LPKDVIIACDFPTAEETFRFLDRFDGRRPFVKIGMELFYAEGPDMVRKLKRRQHRIFLDLKLHDIPNTVGRTVRVLADLGVEMMNVHAMGTTRMMKAAREALEGAPGPRPLLIAVTQLTSTTQEELEKDLRIPEPMEAVVRAYAGNALAAGLDGVVCSPWEAAAVHAACGAEFLTVTPGIRFAENEAGDQRRIMTPAEARRQGSDYIVVGRPITRAPDPAEAYERCCREFLKEGEKT
jgi:orotidine-5'-phosphate decarboxylase